MERFFIRFLVSSFQNTTVAAEVYSTNARPHHASTSPHPTPNANNKRISTYLLVVVLHRCFPLTRVLRHHKQRCATGLPFIFLVLLAVSAFLGHGRQHVGARRNSTLQKAKFGGRGVGRGGSFVLAATAWAMITNRACPLGADWGVDFYP